MALVSYRKKFIFLKTSKTAGTSIEGFLERYCLPEGEFTPQHARAETVTEAGIIGQRPGRRVGNPRFWSHMPARDLKKEVGDDVWDHSFKISVVRDPYDKVVSTFFFRSRVGGQDYRNSSPAEVKRCFKEFVRNANLPIDRNKYTISGKLCTDYVIRYEHLSEDLKELAERLDLEFDETMLPKYKSGHRPEGQRIEDLFDDETSQIVELVYRFEFKTFGYPLLSERYPDKFRRQSFSVPAQVHRVKRIMRSVKRRMGVNPR